MTRGDDLTQQRAGDADDRTTVAVTLIFLTHARPDQVLHQVTAAIFDRAIGELRATKAVGYTEPDSSDLDVFLVVQPDNGVVGYVDNHTGAVAHARQTRGVVAEAYVVADYRRPGETSYPGKEEPPS
jgi:hypothetical protein